MHPDRLQYFGVFFHRHYGDFDEAINPSKLSMGAFQVPIKPIDLMRLQLKSQHRHPSDWSTAMTSPVHHKACA